MSKVLATGDDDGRIGKVAAAFDAVEDARGLFYYGWDLNTLARWPTTIVAKPGQAMLLLDDAPKLPEDDLCTTIMDSAQACGLQAAPAPVNESPLRATTYGGF